MVDILPDDAPAPRLCHLIKWPDFDGYGFNLHAERSNPGQFIGKIDEDSPAQLAGLREGDRIVEVNGVNISNENHRQVVERIKSEPQETRLLVVDSEADAWYREQDFVVKSSQLNVVYIKTPVPRPAPKASPHPPQVEEDTQPAPADTEQVVGAASPTAHSSLETSASDFNDDSIEQQQQPPQSTKVPAMSPPMSPDSGKGDEVAEPQQVAATDRNSLTIEAEINRQSPHRDNNDNGHLDSSAELQLQDSITDQQQQPSESRGQPQQEASGQMQPDSLNQASSISPDVAGSQQDVAEASGKVAQNQGGALEQHQARNGSADSGQSSSPDTGSSDGSIADSLEATVAPKNNAAQQDANEALNRRRDVEDALTIKNYLEAANNKISTNNNNNDISEPTKVTTPIGQETAVSGPETHHHHANAAKQPLRSVLAQSSLNNRANDATSPPQQQQYNSYEEQPLKQQPQSTQQQKNSNNNYSGLNLNMTASEMRELIARRKKFDPKKAQMNIRQKYEIIQQM